MVDKLYSFSVKKGVEVPAEFMIDIYANIKPVLTLIREKKIVPPGESFDVMLKDKVIKSKSETAELCVSYDEKIITYMHVPGWKIIDQ